MTEGDTTVLLRYLSPRARLPLRDHRHRRLAPDLVEIAELQHLMDRTYGARDRARGVPATMAWLAEETGELARAAARRRARARSRRYVGAARHPTGRVAKRAARGFSERVFG